MAVIDTPNAFIHTEQTENKKVYMCLRGVNQVLYKQELNSINMTLKTSLLCYKSLFQYQVENFLYVKPYDICVANK